MFKCPECGKEVRENDSMCYNCKASLDRFLSIIKKANADDAKAQERLGIMYGRGIYVDLDYKKSFYWWKKAAEKGIANAQGKIGALYATGCGVTKDSELGYYWTRKGAENGSELSMVELAKFYFNGEGTDKNLSRALYWLIQARSQGVAEASDILDAMGILDAQFFDEDTMISIRTTEEIL
jgi:TPR repeat protein